MIQKHCSLRVRLLRMLVIPLIITFLITGITSYLSSYHEAEEIYDVQLVNLAKVLRALTKNEINEGEVDVKRIVVGKNFEFHEYEKNYAYRVWVEGQLVLLSSNAESFGPITRSEGFTERMIAKNHWRFFVLRDEKIIIEVAESYEVRHDLIEHILGGIFLPQLLIIPALAFIIWLGVSQGIKPLDVLSGIIRRREPNSLEPIEAPIVPKEVIPLLDSVNDLMHRTSDVLEREKHFSNYAAHELRTPLAALKVQLQVALRTKDREKSKQLFSETLAALERMQHLVEQLLTFVRVQRSDSTFKTLDFSFLCEEVIREIVPQAAQSGRNIEGDVMPNVEVFGNAEMLQALLRNLLSNAMKYTKDGGNIHVGLLRGNKEISLKVSDDGIGISEEDKDRLFDSFYRAAQHHAEGSGLGLGIVRWVADTHHAVIHIDKGLNGKGSCFTITFRL